MASVKGFDTPVRHEGVVESVEGNHVSVKILQFSACAGCTIKGMCRLSEAKEKIVCVNSTQAQNYSKGQSVTLQATARQGVKAVIWAFALPLLFVLMALCVGTRFSEGVAALAAVGVLAPYYAALFVFRNRIAEELEFKIV